MQGGYWRGVWVAVLAMLLVQLAGCSLMEPRKSRRASSVVEYLYPKQGEVAVQPAIPRLVLPINVGIAFVPSAKAAYARHELDATLRMDLMERIAREFRQYNYIQNIALIPSEYLRPAGGFDNLDQLKTMYGVDVIALISYDQIQNTDQSAWSVAYWTIVGAYIFKGERNDTSTLIDAAVFDIASRKMLFRAPGTSQVNASSTIINLSEELRNDSRKGFEEAADNLVVNLTAELERFKVRIKEKPQEAQVVYSKGYSGGGYAGGLFALAALSLLGLGLRKRRRA